MSLDNAPTHLRGPRHAKTRQLLVRLATGEEIVTRNYRGDEAISLSIPHRRGYVVSRRLQDGLRWRHELTPRGREALAEVAG